MERREFIGWCVAFASAAIVGAAGGIADKRESRKGSEYQRRQREERGKEQR